MRNAPNVKLERWRTDGPQQTNCGFFIIIRPGKPDLRLQVSDGLGWDHVSVSCENRCPTWDEMCEIKELVFRDDEAAMQLHPAKAQHINHHPYCLHLWRPQSASEVDAVMKEWERGGEAALFTAPGDIPLPPLFAV